MIDEGRPISVTKDNKDKESNTPVIQTLNVVL